MLSDRQKNFYDEKRQFQGKDDPGVVHPDAKMLSGPSYAQLIFGVLLLAGVAALAVMKVRAAGHEGHEEHEVAPHAAPASAKGAPAAAPGAPAAPAAPTGH